MLLWQHWEGGLPARHRAEGPWTPATMSKGPSVCPGGWGPFPGLPHVGSHAVWAWAVRRLTVAVLRGLQRPRGQRRGRSQVPSRLLSARSRDPPPRPRELFPDIPHASSRTYVHLCSREPGLCTLILSVHASRCGRAPLHPTRVGFCAPHRSLPLDHRDVTFSFPGCRLHFWAHQPGHTRPWVLSPGPLHCPCPSRRMRGWEGPGLGKATLCSVRLAGSGDLRCCPLGPRI